MRKVALLCCVLAVSAAPARAAVESSSPSAFSIRHELVLEASTRFHLDGNTLDRAHFNTGSDETSKLHVEASQVTQMIISKAPR